MAIFVPAESLPSTATLHWLSSDVRPHNHDGVAHLDTLDVHAVRDPPLHHSLGAEVCPLDASLYQQLEHQQQQQ